jgi:hypothetical protein
VRGDEKIMKLKVVLMSLMVCGIFATCLPTVSYAQRNVNEFWRKFKTAVAENRRQAVADMTKFPLSMPFGMKSVKSRSSFLKKYNTIFNGEADAAKCFARSKLEKNENKRYVVACGFKNSTDQRNNPLEYEFKLTKSGWKLIRFDNINE